MFGKSSSGCSFSLGRDLQAMVWVGRELRDYLIPTAWDWDTPDPRLGWDTCRDPGAPTAPLGLLTLTVKGYSSINTRIKGIERSLNKKHTGQCSQWDALSPVPAPGCCWSWDRAALAGEGFSCSSGKALQ